MKSSRRNIIRELLAEKPFISLRELETRFPEVSSMTLRRDIEYFEKQGEAIKVRGGARSMKFITTSMEDSFHMRLRENMTAKEKIARCAIGLIETGRSLFLDSGTTVMVLASLFPDERHNIVTTGPNIALELLKKSRPIVNLVGGMVNRGNLSVSGNQAIRFLEDTNIDIAFIVPSAFSIKDGFTSGNYSECELKSMVVKKARRVVILLDTAKLDKSLPFTFCDLGGVHTIVANDRLPDEICEAAKVAGVEIVIAK